MSAPPGDPEKQPLPTSRGLRLSLPERPVERFHDWLRGSPAGLAAMALVVGAGAGLGAILFRYLIVGFTQLFTGHEDYSAFGHTINPHMAMLGIGFVILVPVVGGPPSFLLLAVRRHDQVLEPAADLQLRRGDRLTLLVKATDADRIENADAALGRISPEHESAHRMNVDSAGDNP